MHDETLYLAKNARPALIPGIGRSKAVFPSLADPDYLDFQVITDLARAKPVYANFRVTEEFDNVASNWLRFAVFISNDPSFADVLLSEELTLATSHRIASPGLSLGARQVIALPPTNSYQNVAAEGRRYMALGFEYDVPSTDWTAGGVDAWLSNYPDSQPPRSPNAGF